MDDKKKSETKSEPQKPALCSAILFSEKVIREAGTGKLSIINSFQSFNGKQFPFGAPPFVVTASFNNLTGKLDRLKASIEVLDFEGNAVMPAIAGEFSSDADVLPDDIFDLSFLVPPCSFERAGTYQIRFKVGEDLLGQRALPARLIEQPGPAQNAEPQKASVDKAKA